jgi:hypothetical protein
MSHHRPTNPGSVPQEYVRSPSAVFLVNPDGSPKEERRHDDTNDEGVQQRRAPDLDAHMWRCWKGEGPGAQLRAEVRSIKSRISWFNGGTAVLSAIGMAVLAAWLSSKFAASERNSIKHADVEVAIQRGASMAVAKYGDDFMKFKTQLEQAAVDVSPLPAPMTTKAKR